MLRSAKNNFKIGVDCLAEKFMRGVYFTNDISQAVKCKTKEDAQKKADAQTLRPIAALTVDSVNFA